MDALSSLTERLGITHVYWIDDENAGPEHWDVEKLIAEVSNRLAHEEEPQRWKKAVGKIKAEMQARATGEKISNMLERHVDDDLADKIEVTLRNLFDEKGDLDPRRLLSDVLLALPGPLSQAQKEAISSVFNGLGEAGFSRLSFADWVNRGVEILRNHHAPENSALLIVDLQNSLESALIDGESVLSQWAATKVDRADLPVFAVALTSKFNAKEELRKSRVLTRKIFGDRVGPSIPILALSKNRLNDADDVNARAFEMFEAALARLRTFGLHSALSEALRKEFIQATERAFSTLQQLTAEELVYAVSTTSTAEGAPEAETLLRMASIAHRRALADAMRDKESVRNLLMELRGLHVEAVHTIHPEDLETTDGIRDLRCSEFNEEPEVVNLTYSPVLSGDIFKVTRKARESEYYVVISNACDLMLRGKTGARKLSYALLVKLQEIEKGDGDAIAIFPSSSPFSGKRMAILDRPAFRRHPVAIIHGNDRGVYGQQ